MAAALDLSNYKSAYNHPVLSFPEVLRPTVERLKWLKEHKDSLVIYQDQVLGEGANGKVYKGSYETANKTRQLCAVKFVRTNGRAEREASTLWKLTGVPHVVRLHATFIPTYYKLNPSNIITLVDEHPGPNSGAGAAAVITDLIEGKDTNITGVPREDLPHFTRQLLQTLSEMHSVAPHRPFPILHGDIATPNLFWIDRELYIIDLGLSGEVGRLIQEVITVNSFRAPEIDLDLTVTGEIRYNEKVDVWSVAAVVFKLFTTQFLVHDDWPGSTICQLVDRLGPPDPAYVAQMAARTNYFDEDECVIEPLGGESRSRLATYFSSQRVLLDFLQRALRWDPAERPSAKKALEHPYVKA